MAKLSDPISVIAHQLKNPIAIVREYLEILKSEGMGQLNAKQLDYLNDAVKNIDQMKEIISDLLDVSKVEGGVYKIKKAPTDLIKITEQIIEEFKILAKSFNCEIVFEKPDKLPLALTDSEKIREVIENLIFNALRYKNVGAGRIEIKIHKKENNVIFSCKDRGVGIPNSDSKKIFSKFFRTSKALQIDPTGTGLGLYINKAIVKMSGGRIWFKNNKDKGATFYFSLPIAK
ncbi:HAMP domain-containing histidine kinase [Patescibacteria group bacterium]|nr:HAMP domain-containing histidine kinase [Patescibacteria group bacterium]